MKSALEPIVTRVAVFDDHPMLRRGVVMTLNEAEDFEVVAEGVSATEAIAVAAKMKPDLVILDVAMPGGGLEAIEEIKRTTPRIKIAMLTISDDLATVQRALRMGVSGFVSKGVEGEDLLACLRLVLRGERYVSPSLAARLLEIASGIDEAPGRSSDALKASLTKREHEMLVLIGDGLTNPEIAERLGLANTTVRQYVTLLFQKIGVRNRTEAALLLRNRPVP